MIHVLHIDTGRDWRGGQAQVYGLMASLRGAEGLRQTLAAPPSSPLAERIGALGFEVLPLPFRGEIDMRSPGRLRQFIRQQEVNVVHAHDAHAHTMGLRAVRPLPEVKLVVHRRVDFPVRHGFFSRRKYGPRVDHFVAISHGVAEVLESCGIAPERITVIHSGVDPHKFDRASTAPGLHAEFGLTLHQPLIGTIGALVDHKGHRFLVEAMPHVLAKHPEVRCVIVGEGELRHELERQIEMLGLDRQVFLAGWRGDIAACLDEFTVFALPSHLEGLCTSLLDATLRDRPLVASDAGGVPEIVQDGKTGWLVPARDPEALAAALIEALENPAEARRRAAAAKRQTIEKFTVQGMARSVHALWQRLLEPAMERR